MNANFKEINFERERQTAKIVELQGELEQYKKALSLATNKMDEDLIEGSGNVEAPDENSFCPYYEAPICMSDGKLKGCGPCLAEYFLKKAGEAK